MDTIFETQRLRLRKLTPGDAGFIVALMNSEGWIRFIGDRHVRTAEQARMYLQNGPLHSYLQHGYGLYLVECKADKTAVGLCGLLKRDYLDSPDIGFAFLPEFTGKGYALESAGAMLQYAQEELGISEVSAITLPDNERSVRLLAKIGMGYKGSCSPPGSTQELSLYSSRPGHQ